MNRRCLIKKGTDIVGVKKYNRGETKILPYLPEKLITSVFDKIHNSPIADAHTGKHRTYAKISDKFFQKNLYVRLKEYVQSCPQCQAYKKSRDKNSPIKERAGKDQRLFCKLYMDACGPFKY